MNVFLPKLKNYYFMRKLILLFLIATYGVFTTNALTGIITKLNLGIT